MRTTAISILLLTIITHGIRGQLNFEGNPLTEDTVYTAEESHLSAEKARSLDIGDTEDSYLLAAKSLRAERAKNEQQENGSFRLNPKENAANSSPQIYRTLPDETLKSSPGAFVAVQNEVHQHQQMNEVEVTADNRQSDYRQENAEVLARPVAQVSERSASALTVFLNSKTPEESKAALQEYLDSQRAAVYSSPESSGPYQPHISEIVLPQQLESTDGGDQQLTEFGQQEGQARYSASQYFAARNINQPLNRPSVRNGPPILRGGPANPSLTRRNFSVRQPPPQYLSPVYRAQSRKGFPGSFPPGGATGVEVIYTKPPGYQRKRYPYSKSPNPYEDASAWFPDADHPPPDMNVYHSQLYAQSYDPYYYGYIAKYGKIKPHLYGKLGKKEEESFLSELFGSFKKHGMKHVMHPMFLLGLGIPMITLMLSALVNNRSFARSISGIDGDHITDEEIDEWIAKLRKALECYSGSGAETDGDRCSVFD